MTFRPDLYRGTALAYARHRPPYPRPLIDHIIRTAVVSPPGRLLDLACGPGPLAIALRDHFAETWAVDSEPDMIAVARTRAPGIRFIKSAAEDLSAPAATFDLITIGNAFPPDAPRRRGRPRPPVAPARRVPGPGLGRLPWPFEQHREPWQDVLREAMERWQPADRIPDGYEENRAARPDLAVLADAGFELAGRQEFPVARSWTLDELAGFLASTSTHSAAALGDRAQDFDADLRRSLLAHNPAAEYPHTLTFSCELARSPAEPRSPT